LQKIEDEMAKTFANLAGFKTWEDAVREVNAGLSVRALRPIYETVKLQSPFSIALMSNVAVRLGLELKFDGADNTPTGEVEYWRLVKADASSVMHDAITELDEAINGQNDD
jgi:hypothetical protein